MTVMTIALKEMKYLITWFNSVIIINKLTSALSAAIIGTYSVQLFS